MCGQSAYTCDGRCKDKIHLDHILQVTGQYFIHTALYSDNEVIRRLMKVKSQVLKKVFPRIKLFPIIVNKHKKRTKLY